MVDRMAWKEALGSLCSSVASRQPTRIKHWNAVVRNMDWRLNSRLVQELRVWHLQGNTVTFNTCLQNCWESILFAMLAEAVEVDVITCNTVLGEVQQWRSKVKILEKLQDMFVEVDVISFNSLLTRAWPLAGCLLEMKGLQLQQTVVSYNAVINTWEAGKWRMVVGLLAGISAVDLVADDVTFVSTISACGRAGQWEHAASLLAVLPDARLSPSRMATNSAISCGHWPLSVHLLFWLQNRSSVSFNAAAAACEKSSRWGSVLSLLDGLGVNGFRRSIVMCNTAISACEGRWLAAEQILRRIPRADVVSYNAVLSACGGGQWNRAQCLLEMIRKHGLRGTLVTFNTAIASLGWPVGLQLLCPDVVSCNALISATNQWQKATWLFEKMLGLQVEGNFVTCSAVVSTSERWTLSLFLLGGLERKMEANEVAYGAVIASCERSEEWQPALAVLSRMPRELEQAVATNTAISACAKCRRWREALFLLQALQISRCADLVSYSSTISACANASEWLQALHIFSQMTELAGLSPDVQCWNASIFACTRAAQWTMALEFLWLGSSKANAITLGACISVCEGVLPRTTLLLVSWVTQLVEEQLAEMSQIGTT
ncbi:unnamed protein product [Durusdinium trenchii]|uniref:Pentatricopeptide repeat-containing protein, chloroplastic n=1 Tax=Durusdinium trenchii TaxID=1381693 RepID=A0ABP0QKB5_9DINO